MRRGDGGTSLRGSGFRDVAPERFECDREFGSATDSGVERVDRVYLVGRELEVEDVDVLDDTGCFGPDRPRGAASRSVRDESGIPATNLAALSQMSTQVAADAGDRGTRDGETDAGVMPPASTRDPRGGIDADRGAVGDGVDDADPLGTGLRE